MAQPTYDEVKRQWESIGGSFIAPLFHRVNHTAPALAKWAYERGVNDTQKTCEQHQDAASVARQNALAQRDEAFAEVDALEKENGELKQRIASLESAFRFEKGRADGIMKSCDEHRANHIAKSDAAIRERDEARAALNRVRADREGQVARQRETILSMNRELNAAIRERDKACSELTFVRADRDMAEGQVVNQREAIASLNRQIAAGARELNQKADTIRTLNAQLVEAQKRDGYWTAWKAVWDTLAGVTGNFSGYRGIAREMACKAIKDLKTQLVASQNQVEELRKAQAPRPGSHEEAWVAVCRVLYEVTPNWLSSFPAEDAAVKAIKGLKKDLDEANKDFDELYEVVKGKQATIDAMNDLENKTIKSLRESLADCTRRNTWQAEELNRMAKKFCGRPWDQTLSV